MRLRRRLSAPAIPTWASVLTPQEVAEVVHQVCQQTTDDFGLTTVMPLARSHEILRERLEKAQRSNSE